MLNGHSSFIIVEMLLLLPLQKFFTLVSLHPIIIFHLNISWRWFFLSILQWIKFWLKYNLLLLKPHSHTHARTCTHQRWNYILINGEKSSSKLMISICTVFYSLLCLIKCQTCAAQSPEFDFGATFSNGISSKCVQYWSYIPRLS